MITSPHNPRVKAAVRLRSSRQRTREGRFLIDGTREIARAIAAGVQLVELYVGPGGQRGESGEQAVDSARAAGAMILDVTPEVFAKVAFGERETGLVAVAETPRRSLADLAPGSWSRGQADRAGPPLVAVIEGLEKPGNVGAILRSADAAGVSAVVVADGGTDLYNPNTIRASLGTVFALPLVAATTAETLAWLRAGGFRIVVARVDGSVVYHQARYDGPTAIVLGSEAAGLTDAWHSPDVTAVRIPMQGIADSLNVSATAAVLFFEARRQRGGLGG